MEGASYKQLVARLLAGLTGKNGKRCLSKDGRAKGKLVLRRYHAPVALRLLGATAATAAVTLCCLHPAGRPAAAFPLTPGDAHRCSAAEAGARTHRVAEKHCLGGNPGA